MRDVCAAGTTAVIISTRDWLGQAHDYLAHGANDQAGLIAAELCAESSFQNLTCLRGGGGGGGWSRRDFVRGRPELVIDLRPILHVQQL